KCPRSLRANLKAGSTKQRGEGQLRIRQKEDRRVKKQKGTATTTLPFPAATAKEQTEQARSPEKTPKPTEPGPAATTERRAAERSERSTTTAAAAAKPESAGSKESAEVAKGRGQRQRP